ncbi:MAG: hypothetical protein ACRECA_08955 [Pseudolabrys sp.]
MTTKGQMRYGFDVFYDDATQEFLNVTAPIQFADDFLGAGHTAGVPAAGSPTAGYPWVKKIVDTSGTPTAAIVANAAGGVMQCALDATSEKQEATLYQNDQKTWDSTKTLIYQARVKLSVLQSASGVEAVWGMSTAWIDGPDNAGEYIEFGCNGSGVVNMRVQDGISQRAVATTFTADTNWHLYRIEMDASGVLHFYIDGVEYSTSTAPLTWGATVALQLYHSVYKPSGVGVATMQIDSVDAWSPRT